MIQNSRVDRHRNSAHQQVSRRVFLRGALKAATVAGLTLGSTRLGWWQPQVGLSASGGVSGVVADLLSGQPVARAVISVSGAADAVAVTDQYGRYDLPLPTGTYDIRASANGFLEMSYERQIVADGAAIVVDLDLIIENPTADQQNAIYERLAQPPEWPAVSDFSALAGDINAAAVTVPETIWVSLNGTTVLMNLDDYLRHVVPAEMPSWWPQQALRAQAVAARTYAVAYGATQSRPICTTTSCQVYGPATYASTDQAVWATHNVVATYGGSIITAFYFSRCNGITTRNSENAIGWQTCTQLNWNYVAYCRARSCGGHSPYSSSCGYYGHGVGMCQWGAWARANEGWAYTAILQHYYTGIQLIGLDTPPQLISPGNGQVLKSGSPIKLTWSGNSGSYSWLLVNSAGTQWGATTSTPSATTLALPAGTYSWSVSGSTGGSSPVSSPTWSFRLVDMPYNRTLSVTKG